MTAVEVGREFLNLTGDVFEIGNKKGTIIDSGTTLAYLPQVIYEPLVKTVSFLHCLSCFMISNFFEIPSNSDMLEIVIRYSLGSLI